MGNGTSPPRYEHAMGTQRQHAKISARIFSHCKMNTLFAASTSHMVGFNQGSPNNSTEEVICNPCTYHIPTLVSETDPVNDNHNFFGKSNEFLLQG